MTCREKLALQHPDRIGAMWFGGCVGCPKDYGYSKKIDKCNGPNEKACSLCWNQEVVEETTSFDIPWAQFKTLIDDAMTKRDRTVSIYFHPENGLSVNVYPWPDAEELYNLYKDGKITANDFRSKMGLAPLTAKNWDMLRKKIVTQEE